MKRFLLFTVYCLLFTALAACQPQAVGPMVMPPFTATPASVGAAATPIPTLAAPVADYAAAEPVHAQPSFKPIGSDANDTGVTPTPSPVPPTATPGPTFTPAPPISAVIDHFWLSRPIAEGGVVWTNKIYPYGSTRGGALRPHHGVEFDVAYGTEIFSAGDGTVVFAGPDDETLVGPQTDFYGNVVVIQHNLQYNGQAVFTLYGHLSTIYVTVGQAVANKELIALSGYSGVADGPHLHFEVRLGSNSYQSTRNPILWLDPFPDRGAVAGRVRYADGTLVSGASVNLRRVDATSNYAATTSYAQETLNGDDLWRENFAFDDVYAGYYEVVVTMGEKKYQGNVWVYLNQVTLVEIIVEPIPEPTLAPFEE